MVSVSPKKGRKSKTKTQRKNKEEDDYQDVDISAMAFKVMINDKTPKVNKDEEGIIADTDAITLGELQPSEWAHKIDEPI